MNYLFLRGKVPTDRDPQEIVFDTIEECDDVWTQLIYAMTYQNDKTELWYWGGNRDKDFSPNFKERWIPSFDKYSSNFQPDVIFCRGGFEQYHVVTNKYPDAVKIYYGAGKRFLPLKGFENYDIILQDSPEQVEMCRKKFPNPLTSLFIKPCAENIFFDHKVKKEYDVCFPANGAQQFKGHSFVYKTAPKDLKILNLGNNPHKIKAPSNVDSYRVLRKDMAREISKCKVGIVAVEGDRDSCPRVIPEMMACDLPVVVLKRVRFWKDKYISEQSGKLSTEKSFWDDVRGVLSNLNLYNARKYYDNNLSLSKAAEHIIGLINKVKK